MSTVKPGDIVLFSGKRMFARVINWYQARFAPTRRSDYNHAAVVVSEHGRIFEVLLRRARSVNMRESYSNSRVAIYRWRQMTPERFNEGMNALSPLQNRRIYPLGRFLLHALRMAALTSRFDPVCAEMAAIFLEGAGARSRPWYGINVNDLHCELAADPSMYELVFEGRLQDFCC